MDSEGGIVYVRDAERLAEDAAFNEGHALGLQFSEKEKAMDSADFLDAEARRQAKAQAEAFDPDAWHRALKQAVPGFWYDQADHHAKGATGSSPRVGHPRSSTPRALEPFSSVARTRPGGRP